MKAIEVEGIINDIDRMDFRRADLMVGISNDALGRSLSICHEPSGIMFQIPFEPIAKYLEKDS